MKISIFIMSIYEKNLLMSIFFFRRQKICWVGSLEKLKINYVWPKGCSCKCDKGLAEITSHLNDIHVPSFHGPAFMVLNFKKQIKDMV